MSVIWFQNKIHNKREKKSNKFKSFIEFNQKNNNCDQSCKVLSEFILTLLKKKIFLKKTIVIFFRY